MNRQIIFFLILFLGSGFQAFNQEADPCKKSTEGTDFWFGFLEGRWERKNHFIEITVTAREATTFTIGIGPNETPYGGTYPVAANNSIQIKIAPSEIAEPRGSEIIEGKGIHLVSEKPVNVYALNYDKRSSDIAVIYPVQSLGKEYYAVCYTPNVNGTTGRNSEFLVVATEDTTTVEITPSKVTDKQHQKDTTFTVVLNKGQVYQVQSENIKDASGEGDLTGSYVVADKPVAFYSGSHGTTIPAVEGTSAWDHLYEQIPPVHSWGREYYTVPLRTRLRDRYRIMAAEDNTTIQVTDFPDIILNKGEFIEREFNSNQPKRIFADKPILVAQYSMSQSSGGGNGDPFMIILSSVTQSKNDVTFVAYQSTVIDNYFVNIIVARDEIDNIQYDGMGISGEFKSFSEGDYSYVQKEVSPGTHRIENVNEDRGFLAYVYGFGNIESYGYGVGFNLDLVLDLGENIDLDGDTLILCYGDSIVLDAGPYFDTYDWNTGDSTQKITVDAGGEYSVKTTTVDGCNLEDSVYIKVSHPIVDIGDDDDGCDPYEITLDATDEFDIYIWQNQNNDTLSKEQVYTASQTGEYRVTVIDSFDCPARDTMKLVVFSVPKVKIEGETLICGKKTSELSVAITEAPDSVWNYEGSFTWSSDNQGLKFTNATHTSVDIEAPDWGEYEIYYDLKTVDGCNSADSFKVRFHQIPTSTFVYVEDPDDECQGYSREVLYTGNATQNGNFYWDFGGSKVVDSIAWNNFVVSMGTNTSKPSIKLYIEEDGCWSTDTTIRFLGANPDFILDTENARGCDSISVLFKGTLNVPDTLLFEWDFGDGSPISNEQEIEHYYPNVGFYDVSLTITNILSGCQVGFQTDSMVKVFQTPTAEIAVDQSTCFPDSAALFYVNSIDSSVCHWTFTGAEQSGPGNDSITVVINNPTGTVGLIVDEYGCFSEPTEVLLKRKPHFNFHAENEEGCQPYPIEIFANPEDGQLNFTWLTDTLPHPIGDSNIYLLPDSGRFDITLIANSDETGCADTLTKPDWIWVHPKPIAAFEVDYEVALIEHANITYTNLTEYANIYLWDFGDNTETSTEENPMHKFTELGEYTSELFVESAFGCLDTSDLLITILPFSVFTPNAFRPNSDIEENRTFMPVGLGADVSRFYLKIYDRWGQLVFETQTPENKWDGTTKNGKDAPMGNYVWISNYYDIQGFEHQQKGQVLLVR